MGTFWGQKTNVEEFYCTIRAVIPAFDFAYCTEIEFLDLEKAAQFEISIRCGLIYTDGLLIEIEFSKAWKINIQLAGGMIEVVSLFISYPPGRTGPEDGYFFYDEHSEIGWCFETMRLIDVTKDGTSILPPENKRV